MSQAYDLAVSITPAASTPGIAHDPASPLVLGSVAGGEFLVLTYDPITHMADLEVASNVINLISILSFGADGTLLINGQTVASTGNIDQAVQEAYAAAAAAAASATAAQQSMLDTAAIKLSIDAQAAEFSLLATEATQQTSANADRAETAVANAEGIRNAAAASADVAAVAAGDAAAARDEAIQRASADPSIVFVDGTKSARGYAADAAQSATLNRAAQTRSIGAADLPETVVPGHLFTRARCLNTAPGTVNIGPNVWTNQAGEAWATYRLEKTGGSITFQGAGGSSTVTAPGFFANAPTAKARGLQPVSSSMTLLATCTPPVGFTGRFVVMMLYNVNNGNAYTMSVSFSGGVSVVTRRAVVSPGDADFSPMAAVFEGSISGWDGTPIEISAVCAPGIIYWFTKPIFITGGDFAVPPIVGYAKPAGSQSSAGLTLAAVPAQSLVLASAFQRKPTSVFGTWGSNMQLIEKGNLLGAGPAPASMDTNEYRNGSYGVGQGVAAGTGNFVVTANYEAAVDRIGVLGIAYPPGIGASAPIVDMTFAGGRNTLTEVGSEAEVWFNPDGRSVFVQIPKP